MKTKIATDTATIVVFDPSCLKHRLTDDCDWWSIENEEMAEVNEGNALFVGVGSDGAYEIEITDACPPQEKRAVVAHLKVESGKVFVGAGEWTTGGDLEPEALHGGVFIDILAGPYRVSSWMRAPGCVCLKFDRVAVFSRNEFLRSLKIA